MTKLPVVKHNPRLKSVASEEESGQRGTKWRGEVEQSGGVRRRSERRIAEALTLSLLVVGWGVVNGFLHNPVLLRMTPTLTSAPFWQLVF